LKGSASRRRIAGCASSFIRRSASLSPSLSDPDRATIVTIDCFAGRSLEAKRRLYAEIGERFEALGIPRDHVSVILQEITQENWGTRGQPASDVDLGFTIEV